MLEKCRLCAHIKCVCAQAMRATPSSCAIGKHSPTRTSSNRDGSVDHHISLCRIGNQRHLDCPVADLVSCSCRQAPHQMPPHQASSSSLHTQATADDDEPVSTTRGPTDITSWHGGTFHTNDIVFSLPVRSRCPRVDARQPVNPFLSPRSLTH